MVFEKKHCYMAHILIMFESSDKNNLEVTGVLRHLTTITVHRIMEDQVVATRMKQMQHLQKNFYVVL